MQSLDLLREYVLAGNQFKFLAGSYGTWNTKTNKFIFNPKPFVLSHVICIILGISFFTLLFQKFYNSSIKFKDDPYTISASIWVMTCLIVVVHLSDTLRRKWDSISGITNALIQFESKIPQRPNHDSSKVKRVQMFLSVCLCKTMRIAGICLWPFLCAAIANIRPDMPFNLFLNPPCSWVLNRIDQLLSLLRLPLPIVNYCESLLSYIGNYWLWLIILKAGIFTVIQVIVLTTWLSNVMDTVQRFYRNINSTGSAAQITTERRSSRLFITYRQIQIMCTIFNDFNSMILLSVLVSTMLVQIVIFTVIASDTKANNVYIDILYVIVLIDTYGIINILTGFSGSIHKKSSKLLDDMKHDTGMIRSKFQKRVIRSLPTVKNNFGTTNYIDKLTPIVFQEFSMKRTIDVMLLSKD